MRLLQIKFTTTKASVELIETLLLNLGSLGITLDDAKDQPLLEPLPGEMPIWDDVVMTGLFDETQSPDAIIGFVTQQAPVSATDIQWVEEQAWERAWMDHYHPFPCGDRLWIVPDWLTPPNPDAVNLMLDPGLAFGTGDHPSTFMCLKWLDKQPLTGKTVVDYGCGSGILGIAALLLGAEKVYAVDIDPQAVLATKQNAENNGVGDKLWVGLPEEFELSYGQQQYDVVVANILAGPLAALSPLLSSICAQHGSIALAGLIDDQVDDLITTYTRWFDMTCADRMQDNWCLLSGIKHSS